MSKKRDHLVSYNSVDVEAAFVAQTRSLGLALYDDMTDVDEPVIDKANAEYALKILSAYNDRKHTKLQLSDVECKRLQKKYSGQVGFRDKVPEFVPEIVYLHTLETIRSIETKRKINLSDELKYERAFRRENAAFEATVKRMRKPEENRTEKTDPSEVRLQRRRFYERLCKRAARVTPSTPAETPEKSLESTRDTLKHSQDIGDMTPEENCGSSPQHINSPEDESNAAFVEGTYSGCTTGDEPNRNSTESDAIVPNFNVDATITQSSETLPQYSNTPSHLAGFITPPRYCVSKSHDSLTAPTPPLGTPLKRRPIGTATQKKICCTESASSADLIVPLGVPRRLRPLY
mmetsp:Transcript_24331/g.35665  ORF Transcript_24331/g.35665 Transcript_24331/m.35665 type:complete len:347 (+) Transcript_24331:175-1215(+)|eukprot:CAMPEP_0185041648 /NCGR_PEP_ID=MMETSP1103-20130426/41226_1 /TAXON_ID=36769 /ORGANISM="Paraphysomonas bandaiensis, Strain Caron Lab Isolate" /LENGTH=346 /DNA_ID=CAMNT_0027581481 /DNA_START=102 /DNA_END=1142 /DNA_ORIENTATION=-